jgi:hypothetical protein
LLETIFCISILWFTPSLILWLVVFDWFWKQEVLTIGHIIFAIFTYPMTILAVIVYLLFLLIIGFIKLCNIKIRIR